MNRKRVSGGSVSIKMRERDNVAIAGNAGGRPAATVLAPGPMLREHLPQGHRDALVDFASTRGAAAQPSAPRSRPFHSQAWDNASACRSTSVVASSCLSGGYL